MNYALHRQTRRRIYATSQDVARYAVYVCEECEVPVHFVRAGKRHDGVFIPAHFNHESNSKRARTCRLFREGAERNGEPLAHRMSMARQRPELMLRIAGRDHWQLGVFLPRFETDADSLFLGNASPCVVPFDLRVIGPAGEVTELYPQREDYVFELRKGKTPVRAEALPGLGNLALFTASSTWGRRLGVDEMLAWGRTYVVVGQQLPAAFLKLVPSRTLAPHPCANFQAALFALPAASDSAVSRGFAKTFGREIRDEAVVLSIISPANARLLPSGAWLLPAGCTSCVVAFSFSQPLPGPGVVLLRHAVETIPDDRVHLLAGTNRGCVELSNLVAGRYEIRFDHTEDGGVPIEVPAKGDALRPAHRPAVVFGVCQGERSYQHNLWDIGLAEVFRGVALGALTLQDIRIPPGATLRIEAKSDVEELRKKISFSEAEPQDALEEKQRELTATIARILRARGSISLDAGGFGNIDFAPAGPIVHVRPRSDRSRWLDLVRQRVGVPTSRKVLPVGALRRFQAHLRAEAWP